MAPGFLSKLVKPSAKDSLSATDPSLSRRRSFSSTNRSSKSLVLGHDKASFTPDAPTLDLPADADDSNPSVNIVPPSPSFDQSLGDVDNGEQFHNHFQASDGGSNDPEAKLSSTEQGRRRPPSILAPTPKQADLTINGGARSAPIISAGSSTPNLATLLTPNMLSPSPKLTEKSLPHKTSSASMRSQPRASTPLNEQSHARAPTTPLVASHNDNAGITTNGSAITSSPEEIKPTILVGSPESGTFTLPSAAISATVPPHSATFLTPRSDTDASSVISSKKKRPWRRSSPPRKPSGLASAIAASGLAIANPNVQVRAQPSPTKAKPDKADKATTDRRGSDRKGTKNSEKDRRNSRTSSMQVPASPRTLASIELARSSASLLEEYESPGTDSSSGDRSDEDDELDIDLGEDMPVTGFAVASSKRNADFHELFKNIPEGDYLIDDYGCALQREILVQGRLYVSENHLCFHANIFGWVTDLSVPMYEITSLEKKMTALIIPNAIQVTTRQSKYTFASFLSRDTTFDVIHNIWRLARPQDTTYEGTDAGSLKSFDAASRDDGDSVRYSAVPVGNVLVPHKVTHCQCSKEGQHFSETALETVLPGAPEKIHNLIFASGFMKDFMRENQKLLDIQISDWTPISSGSKLLTRNMSYIKPLGGSLGPKQTKCELKDEVVYCDFDHFISTITTTRTPDVPSGGVFSVKTRTCIMWASGVTSKVVVTCQVEWTGRSFIKGIIEKSALEGQKTYHSELDQAMRMYIQEHQSEFIPEGLDPAAVAPGEPATAEAPSPQFAMSVSDTLRERERERNRRGLQWAWDTFEGASQVAKRSTSGAIELIKDAWDQSTSTTILYFVIAILVISNVWTLMMMGSREEAGRRKELRRMEEREKWVQGIVKGLWEEMATGKMMPVTGAGLHIETVGGQIGRTELPVACPTGVDLREEISAIKKTLDVVDERVRNIRESLLALD